MAVEEPDSGVTGDLSIIVPCFNERPTIEVILRRLRDTLPDAEIVVVDDGSTDGSREIATSLAEALRLRLICLETRGGKGAAVRAGVNAAGGEWIVIQDADLEYDPADLPGMLDAARLRSPCAVYGSRYLGRAAAPPRLWLNYIGVRLLAILEYVLYGIWLSDPHTCYKMLPASMIRQLNLRSNGFELCAEINSKGCNLYCALPRLAYTAHSDTYVSLMMFNKWGSRI
ncbi:MAG: glycosyltransferase family 2 protein [Candidatus Hydrogenedentes bacterium]|nr:glycosyltransferase family 2 protein [Candidatus Hydrogenedentota bacterium]